MKSNIEKLIGNGGQSGYLLINGDSLEAIKQIPDSSIDICITDPPYFIGGMGSNWDHNTLKEKIRKAGTVGGLPPGMKFDKEQGVKFQMFMYEISKEIFRVLKPGSFYIAFSQARLYHRLAIAADDSGFEIRDMLGWTYEGQAKAFSQEHFVKKMNKTDSQKADIISKLQGRKTAQLKPCIEPMILAQKPKEGTYVENWLKHGVGLIDTSCRIDEKFPGNLMPFKKPKTKTLDGDVRHPTVKPVELISHLISIFATKGNMLLDPFSGSGSHGVAAVSNSLRYIGIERDPEYVEVARKRLSAIAGDVGVRNVVAIN